MFRATISVISSSDGLMLHVDCGKLPGEITWALSNIFPMSIIITWNNWCVNLQYGYVALSTSTACRQVPSCP